MWRSLVAITAAIQFAAPPSMPKSTAERYAKVIQEEAKARDFDPFTLVAMVHNESKWSPGVVNSVNCVGLGQVCLSNYAVCRASLTSAQCRAKKHQLMDGVYNLRVISNSITLNRKFCRKKTGKPVRWRYWLPSHGGWNQPSKSIWCGQQLRRGRWVDLPVPKIVQRIMNYRKKLIRKFARK